MRALGRTHPTKVDMKIVGYIDRRSGQISCARYGIRDIESRRTPWSAIYVVHPHQAGYASTTAITCHRCGTWINDESTGYAIAATQDGHSTRYL